MENLNNEINNRMAALKAIIKEKESALVIGGVKIYPDFTVLNVRTRETIYLEHLGMMDDPQYYESAIKRIQLTEGNVYEKI